MLAEIITIGDEILIGQIVDTNSAWMATKLNQAGVLVKQITSVSDDAEHITEALRQAANRADIIIMTGGLGPTKDDITKKTLAKYFNAGFKRDEKTLENVKNIFKKFNRPLLDVNIQQADVPENCKVLLNENGTAPGMWFDEDGKVYVSLPGVPFEMMYLMEDKVIPELRKRFEMDVIVHQTILTAGVGESFLAEQIADIEESLPSHIKLAYLPKLGIVRLRLSASAAIENQKTVAEVHKILADEIGAYSNRIIERVGDAVFAVEDISLEKALLNYLEKSKLTLSVAESCTGGFISQLITQHPGSSKVFLGGAVTYSNGLKKSVLGVANETLENFGAVSEQTVLEMAQGAIRQLGSDCSIAVSGIAGPDGGTEEKSVGTVWIAVASADGAIAKKFQFGNKRQQNIERAAISALTMLFKFVRKSV
ncbi:competence/damage-inducible protein A [Pedobacter sp. HMF7647]|uniref:CinA-like protein n=1 Tax=Hufsiella arboris TaxID=2695275 RepID=A0A7K1YDK2_9SPHI|nr:competence/damage-inducible protein A [Hufsiella arboris]MXV52441.1 competence/damage-inducible protein A [Hufsiella arboris]